MTFALIAALTGITTAVLLDDGPPKPAEGQRIEPSRTSTTPAGDGPPMDHGGGFESTGAVPSTVTETSKVVVTKVPQVTSTTTTSATEITTSTTTTTSPSEPDRRLTVTIGSRELTIG
ncbi:hypothetical protein LV78_004819 [Actinosynnema pretiosum]|uniref:hypothetical protein n=1 Tax=Actinosynnema pretiosum TaxID=42197 RepID=UPI0020A2E0D9|nr:hypothetical protein [Actinosynnema pretiosum]MCP2096833.1 hypothetical protein [Actinosynnema pretiosum]